MKTKERLMVNCERDDLNWQRKRNRTHKNSERVLNHDGLDRMPAPALPALVFSAKQKAVIRTALQGSQRKISCSLSFCPFSPFLSHVCSVCLHSQPMNDSNLWDALIFLLAALILIKDRETPESYSTSALAEHNP